MCAPLGNFWYCVSCSNKIQSIGTRCCITIVIWSMPEFRVKMLTDCYTKSHSDCRDSDCKEVDILFQADVLETPRYWPTSHLYHPSSFFNPHFCRSFVPRSEIRVEVKIVGTKKRGHSKSKSQTCSNKNFFFVLLNFFWLLILITWFLIHVLKNQEKTKVHWDILSVYTFRGLGAFQVFDFEWMVDFEFISLIFLVDLMSDSYVGTGQGSRLYVIVDRSTPFQFRLPSRRDRYSSGP